MHRISLIIDLFHMYFKDILILKSAYFFLDHETSRVYMSRHVVFHESVFPFQVACNVYVTSARRHRHTSFLISNSHIYSHHQPLSFIASTTVTKISTHGISSVLTSANNPSSRGTRSTTQSSSHGTCSTTKFNFCGSTINARCSYTHSYRPITDWSNLSPESDLFNNNQLFYHRHYQLGLALRQPNLLLP